MKYQEHDLGFSTADASDLSLTFDSANLVLRFCDWQEKSVKYVFRDVLAMQWGASGPDEPADDRAYVVEDSPILVNEAALHQVPPGEYIHYALGFNAIGWLNVIARRAS